jgi:hypothetical protein
LHWREFKPEGAVVVADFKFRWLMSHKLWLALHLIYKIQNFNANITALFSRASFLIKITKIMKKF